MVTKHDCSKCKLHKVLATKIECVDKDVYVRLSTAFDNLMLAIKMNLSTIKTVNNDELVKYYEQVIDDLCNANILLYEWWKVMTQKYNLNVDNRYYRINTVEENICYCVNEKGEPVNSEIMIPKDGINLVYL